MVVGNRLLTFQFSNFGGIHFCAFDAEDPSAGRWAFFQDKCSSAISTGLLSLNESIFVSNSIFVVM